MVEHASVGRYPFLDSRQGVWREIARYVAKDARGAEVVIELGAGFCDFINQFPARKKIAFDLNAERRTHAARDVEFRDSDACAIAGVADASVELIFSSNFLEHLPMSEVERLLSNAHRVLAPRGRIILLQPNHRLCAEHYFDDPTHVTIFSDENIRSVLAGARFHVVKLVPGLLPFSMKSRLPKWPILVRAYLASPVKPNAAQMYVVAEKI